MIKNRYKKKKKPFFKIIIDLFNINQRITLLFDNTTIKTLKVEIL